MIPYGCQKIDEDDIQAVVDALKKPLITQGDAVDLFEASISNEVSVNNVIACNSGTSALILACMALEIGVGDTVWTSPISFVASANCALLLNAKVDFVDIDSTTFNLCPLAFEEKLRKANTQNQLPKVLIVVHFAGLSVDMEPIAALCKQYNISIIEDASHALGGSYHGYKVGSCQFSDLTVFSFHPVKHITTGEGGAVCCKSPLLAQKLRKMRSHGITRESSEFLSGSSSHPLWYYEQHSLGYNFRLPDLLAALGSSQIRHLQKWLSKRSALAKNYHDTLPSNVKFQFIPENVIHAWHLFVIQLPEALTGQRDVYFEKLRDSGIGVNLHYIPIYLQPFYQKLGFKQGYCMNAESYFAKTFTLPLHQQLSDSQQMFVVEKIAQLVNDEAF